MESREPNGTMTTLVYIQESPKNQCIDMNNFQWLYTYYPHYMWFIFVLGSIENLFVISVFFFHKSRCTVAEIYLGNMAVADLAFVITLPFGAIYISNKYYWPFGSFLCVALNSMFLLNLYSSIYFLMMVSIDRYLALVKAMTIGRLRRPGWAKIHCGIIWIFATVINVPVGMFRKVRFYKELNATSCVLDTPSTNWYIAINLIMNVFGFLVPLVVITFCTSQIICVLRNNAMRQFKKDNKERKATQLVLSVLLVFILCWLPYNISIFIYILHRLQVYIPCMVISVNHIIYQIFTYIALSNSCINPIIYIMVGNVFRQKARELYCRFLCKGSVTRMSSF